MCCHATTVTRTRPVVAVIIALVGLVWLGQGLGYVPGSFMTGDPTWAILGALLIVGAAAYGFLPRLRRG